MFRWKHRDVPELNTTSTADISFMLLVFFLVTSSMDSIDRQLTNYGSVQISNMEKGCSWIRLFIAVAPSLGFLGTVIGMVMAFDQIQQAGDIGPTIVAQGMKVALITTIFGIVVALILQLFYSYILSKIERLTAQMEESAILLMDMIAEFKGKVRSAEGRLLPEGRKNSEK